MLSRLFIVGVGRSGTSLLQAMLASNPAVDFLPETSFFRRYVISNALSNVPVEEIKPLLLSDPKLKRINSVEQHIEKTDWNKPDAPIRFYELIATSDNQWIGDKDPRCIEYQSAIHSRWPTAKIIHIFRDPRDVVCSKKKSAWSKGRNLFSYLVAGQAQIAIAQRYQKTVDNDLVVNVKYEDLLANPDEQLRKLCDFLNIDFHDGMLDFGQAASRLVAKDELQWKQETLGPLLRNNSQKWKAELSPFDIYAIENSCTNVIELGAYQTNQTSPPPLLSRLTAWALIWSVRIASLVYVRSRERKNKQSSNNA